MARPWARHYRALTLVGAEDPTKAETTAAAAIRLYQAAPARARSYGCQALAGVQLAKAQLMNKKLDAAAEILADTLDLAQEMRISSLNHNLDTCRTLLRDRAYRTSPVARRLDRQLAEFRTVSAAQALSRRR